MPTIPQRRGDLGSETTSPRGSPKGKTDLYSYTSFYGQREQLARRKITQGTVDRFFIESCGFYAIFHTSVRYFTHGKGSLGSKFGRFGAFFAPLIKNSHLANDGKVANLTPFLYSTVSKGK